jgi:sugar phosphate isomerase/epimerase
MNSTRRTFLQTAIGLSAGALASRSLRAAATPASAPWFEISLAQWSLNRAFRAGTLDAMDFARIAKRDYGISAIEYVNQFYMETLTDGVVAELRKRADGEGVTSILIMCDREGRLGDPDPAERGKAVSNHHRWVHAAKTLGCHAIRVNAASLGTFEEQQKLAADGLRALAQYADGYGINVIVENHGGLSSNGSWLAGVMKLAAHPRVGTLPDFGNFRISPTEEYDRYKGTEELMPFAKGVSAKALEFDEAGNEKNIDFRRLLATVKAAGYRGHIGIEYEGRTLSEPDGIRATKALLERLRVS